MPDRMQDRMSEDMPDRMPEDMPEHMPVRVPEDMPDRMPDRMPEDMPGRMPEDMPDRMPEDWPVTKRINVMVGITRSKVVFEYSYDIPIDHPFLSHCSLPLLSPHGAPHLGFRQGRQNRCHQMHQKDH